MKYVSIKNFEQFQHYKDRSPPWIKLYNSLLDDYDFGCLQDASKLHLVMIWLLASRNDNRLPADPNWIARRINATEPVDVSALIEKGFLVMEQDASDVLADCKQVAIPERETERETEREKSADAPPSLNGHSASRRFTPPSLEEVSAYIRDRGSPIDPEAFIAYYTARGWKLKTGLMSDWRAAVITWEKRHKAEQAEPEQRAWR